MINGFIYGLIDPRTRELRYIGQTTRTVAQRLASHVSPKSTRAHSRVARWIGGLIKQGHRPIAVPMAVASTREQLDALEVAFIAHLRGAGARLKNHTEGGGGRAGYVPTAEERERSAAAQRGVPKPKHTDEWRARMSASKKGKPSTNSAEHHARIGASKRGIPRSPEVRAKISAARKGKRAGEYTTERMALAIAALKACAFRADGAAHPAYRHDISTEEICKRIDGGETKAAIARDLGVTRTFINRRLAAKGSR